jgi:cell division protein FtsW
MAGGRASTIAAVAHTATAPHTATALSSSQSHRAKKTTPGRILGPRLLFILTTITLLVFGLVMVYSASFVEAFTNPDIQDGSYIFRRQLQLTGLGLLLFAVAVAVNYHIWNSFLSWAPWALIVVLLVITWVMGNEELGGKRWIDVFGHNLQPSEFAKIALLLLVGKLLVKLYESDKKTPVLIQIAVAIALPILLIMLQPDFGTALIVLVGIVAIAWFGEFPLKPLVIAFACIIALAIPAILLASFRVNRIKAWFDPWAYASEEGYQIVNSFYAFADGGVTGVGLGMSHQKYLYLPQPHNDLIFPIIGEEFGLIGAAAVVVLFMLFLYSAYRIARGAPDLYGRVIAGASATLIGFQAFLNMLCMVNLLPLTGKPLPFFSAGGSSIIVTLILVGLILNVSLRSNSSPVANQRRDDLLIIEGGRAAAQRQGSGVFVGWSRLGELFHRQSAQPKSSGAFASQLRKAPVGAPARVPANPMLRMSPARNRGRDGSNLSGDIGAGSTGRGVALSTSTRGTGGTRNVGSARAAGSARNTTTARTATTTAVRAPVATTTRATTTARNARARAANPRSLNNRSPGARKDTLQ